MGKGMRAAAGPRARASGRGQRKCVVESLSCNICHYRYVYMELGTTKISDRLKKIDYMFVTPIAWGWELRGVKIVHRNYVIHSERLT